MPALGTTQPASYQLMDFSGEKKSLTFDIGEITALTIAARLGDLSDFEDALDAVILGVRAAQSWGSKTVVTNTRPAVADAQIETEMLVTYRDVVTEAPYSFRIPTVDYTAFNYADPPAGDNVIISGAGASEATTNFVAAFEAVAVSPGNDANAVEITGMRVVR